MNRCPHLLLFVLLGTAWSSNAAAQTIVRHPDPAASLSARWKWAREEAQKRGFEKGYWIGYSIRRLMSENSYIGSFYSDPRRNRPSLGELITGTQQLDLLVPGTSGDVTENDGETIENDTQSSHRKITKEVAILFRFAGGRADEPDGIKVSNLSLHVEFEDYPLFWVGGGSDGESIEFLKSHFAAVQSSEVKKDLVRTIGLHEPSPTVFSYLRDLLNGSERGNVRGEAAFWLGQMNTDEALGVLLHVAESDRSDEVRKQAVFGISQMDGDRGTDALIKFAREGPDRETRKNAAFWLGQRASQKAVTALKNIIYSDKDTELQRNALFALTQIGDGDGIEDVIKIAKTHPNPKIRKEAIFWLCQSDDKRAVEALVVIVRH